MKIQSPPNIRLYLFIGIFALLLTYAFRPLFLDWFQIFKINVEKDRRSFPRPCIMYHDLDHDGYSEMAVLKNSKSVYEPALKILAHNGGIIDQWTFEEPWLPNSMLFGDYNHDGHDEVYVFTKTADSLFLYAVDYRNRNSFLLHRKFIAHAPPNKKRWDIRPIPGMFLDSDGDGYDDLIFYIPVGAAIYPRGLYCYSIQKQKLLYRSTPGSAMLSRPTKVRVNQQTYILMEGSYAPGNADVDTAFSDRSSWLCAYDKKLNFVFPPIKFDYFGSEISALPFGLQNEKILVLLINRSKVQPFSRLLTYNWQGMQLKRQDLQGTDWELSQIGKPPKKTILIDKKLQLIYYLTSSIELRNPRHYSRYFRKILNNDLNLDKDLKYEILAENERKTPLLFSSDFQHSVQVPLPHFLNAICSISINKNGNGHDQLYLQCGQEKYFLSYHVNPLYSLRYLAFFLLFLVIFFVLWQGVGFYNYFSAYKTTLNSILCNPDRGMMLLKPNGKIKFMNHALTDQFKLGITEYKGRSAVQLFADYPSFLKIIQNLLHNPKKIKQNISIQENGIDLKGILYAKPIRVLLGSIYGFYIEVKDYSQTIEDARLKIWSKAVQKMAHDIKTPLSSISINLSMVKQKLADHLPQALKLVETDIELMLDEMNRLRQMTKNFLKFTNMEKPNLQTFSLSAFLQEVVEDFKSYYTETVEFRLEINYEKDLIRADRAQLKMVMHALIENAIDAIKANGIVGITVNHTQKIDQGFEDFVEIEVFDSGPAIPEEIKEKLFEPYFTTKPDGTGMGLAIAKKIIEDHNGEIELVSTEKFSTVFRIMFPIGNILE